MHVIHVDTELEILGRPISVGPYTLLSDRPISKEEVEQLIERAIEEGVSNTDEAVQFLADHSDLARPEGFVQVEVDGSRFKQ